MNIVLEDLNFELLSQLLSFKLDYKNLEQISFIDNRTKIVDYGNLELYEDIPHNSLYHLETVKEHIERTVELAKEDLVLCEVAKYHDIGKFYLQQTRYGYNSYIGHELISTYLYLISKPIDEIDLKVATIISRHGKEQPKIYENEVYKFRNLDREASVRLDFEFLRKNKLRKEQINSTLETINFKGFEPKQITDSYTRLCKIACNYKQEQLITQLKL